MKKLTLVCPLLFITLGVSVGGATIHVPAEQPTIQAGINAAVDGDTVLVAPGSYSENLNFLGKEIVVTSENGSGSASINGADTSRPIIKFGGGERDAAEFSGFEVVCKSEPISVYVSNASTPRIADNVFHSKTSYDVVIGCFLSSPLIINNLFYDNTGISCVGLYGGSARIISNTFDRNGRGFFSTSSGGIALNNIVTNSLRPRDGGYGIHGPFAVEDYNNVWNNVSNYENQAPGPHDISADPQFSDTAVHDYSLLSTSPCIDAGNPSVLYNDPDGTRSDMGASYFIQVSPPSALNINYLPDSRSHILALPTFSWTFHDSAGVQVAYQIQVGVDSDWGVVENWDSGEQYSTATSAPYFGSSLADGVIYQVRIRVKNSLGWGGWRHSSFRLNTPPSTPSQVRPAQNAVVSASNVNLKINNSTDNESDTRSYQFQIADNETMSNLIFDSVFASQMYDTTSTGYILGLSANGDYWWRVRASDGFETSSWSLIRKFTTIESNGHTVPIDYSTIQDAIVAAKNGDTVIVLPGLYQENINLLGKRILLTSEQGPANTVIRTSSSIAPVVMMNSGETRSTILHGLTIDGGLQSRGFVLNVVSPTITGCVICSCLSVMPPFSGGGIRSSGASPFIAGTTFFDNQSTDRGGAIYHAIPINSSESAVIDECIFYHNGPCTGSAIYCVGSGSSMIIKNNYFYRNDLASSTALLIEGEGVLVINNTITLNPSGLVCDPCTNCEIVNNIVAFNAASNLYSVGGVSKNNLTFESVSWSNSPGQDGVVDNPLFNDTVSNDFSLSPTSPCIDAGDSSHFGLDADGTTPEIGASYFTGTRLSRLFVDGVVANKRVLNTTPLIGWHTWAPPPLARQEFEIEVGSDSDWQTAESWDPATFVGADTSIIYGGVTLSRSVDYFTRVRVRYDTGWTDWKTGGFRINSPPPTPITLDPTNRKEISSSTPTLAILALPDSDGDSVFVSVLISHDSIGSDVIYSDTILRGMGDTISVFEPIPLVENEIVWWTAEATDHYQTSTTSIPHQFAYNFYSESPTAFDLATPTPNQLLFEQSPTFSWHGSHDADPFDHVKYRLRVLSLPSLTYAVNLSAITDTQLVSPVALNYGAQYTWIVEASDDSAQAISSAVRTFSLRALGDVDGTNELNVGDAVFLLTYIFQAGQAPYPLMVGDVDGSCDVNIGDVTYLIARIFGGGPPPVVGCAP